MTSIKDIGNNILNKIPGIEKEAHRILKSILVMPTNKMVIWINTVVL